MNAGHNAALMAAFERDLSKWSPPSKRSARPAPQDVIGLRNALNDSVRWSRDVEASLRETLRDLDAGRLRPVGEGEHVPSFAEVWQHGRQLRNFAVSQSEALEDLVREMSQRHPAHAVELRAARQEVRNARGSLVDIVDQVNELLRDGYVNSQAPLLADENHDALLILAR